MSQLIVTSRYLKNGIQKSKNKRKNYTKYIATRETVEIREQKSYDLNAASTEKQKEILNELITDFPEVKRYLEYEDFITNPTVGNASELINTIIERNADVIGKWSKNYKEACKLIYDKNSKLEDFQKAEQLLLTESQSGNVLATHDLGKLYSTDKLGEEDLEKSQKYYSEALKGFLEIEPTASKLKAYVQYRIGKMYCYGLGTEKDHSQAVEWLSKSLADGNEYTQKLIDDMEQYENAMLANTVFGLFVNLSRCIEDDYMQKYRLVRRTVDSKLRRMIQQKQQALGTKNDVLQL